VPLFYWLANTYAVADRYFAPTLGGTWANRDFMYAATSDGVLDTGERVITVRNIFDVLDAAQVSWGVYSNGTPRQDCLGWQSSHAGVHNYGAFQTALAAGTLRARTPCRTPCTTTPRCCGSSSFWRTPQP
jgi:phospholipase C